MQHDIIHTRRKGKQKIKKGGRKGMEQGGRKEGVKNEEITSSATEYQSQSANLDCIE